MAVKDNLVSNKRNEVRIHKKEKKAKGRFFNYYIKTFISINYNNT